VYAYVSRWLSEAASQGKYPAVPHIVTPLPMTASDLRAELGIPPQALVFGRHGGSDSFDIPFAHVVIQELVKHRSDLYFLFLGTNQFCEPHSNIIHLPPTADIKLKARFVSTCDAMLHARLSGETFGLAIAEFSALNKPVITYDQSHERAHLEILGDRGLYYSDATTLTSLLWNFAPQSNIDWRVYSDLFTPESVMRKFNDVFLGTAA
jgi:glycosyltransferase involved in cell wall biosynthesis